MQLDAGVTSAGIKLNFALCPDNQSRGPAQSLDAPISSLFKNGNQIATFGG